MNARKNYVKTGNDMPSFWKRWLVSLLFGVLCRLPQGAKNWLADRLGPRLLKRNWRRARITAANLSIAFPAMSVAARESLAEEFSRKFIRCVLDVPRMWFRSDARLGQMVRFEGEERLSAALAEGRGAILLAGHMVGLEIGGLALATRFPMLALTSEAKGSLEEWIFSRLRRRYSDVVLDRTVSMRRVIRELQGGRVLYYLPDEDHGHLKPSEFVPFFGRPTATLTGAGRLLAMAAVPVFPTGVYFDETSGVYTIRIHPGITVNADPIINCAMIRRETESLIRAQPSDYLWTLRMFNNEPDGSANPLYPPPKIPL